MRKSIVTLALAILLLIGCGGSNNTSSAAPTTTTVNSNISMVATNWHFIYGSGNPVPEQEQSGAVAFNIPNAPSVLGYFVTSAHPASTPQILSLTFKVIASDDAVYNAAIFSSNNNSTDANPAKFSLFLERRNDDVTDAGKADYRQWTEGYVFGSADNQTLTIVAPLVQEHWTNVFGQHTGLIETMNDLANAGLTFGGRSFAGHGIQMTSGSARLVLYDYRFVY